MGRQVADDAYVLPDRFRAHRFTCIATAQASLRAAGANVKQSLDPTSSFVVEDRRLLTAQNPQSAVALGKRIAAFFGQFAKRL